VTQSQAATVASALITAGYVPTVSAAGAVWKISAATPNGVPIPASTVATFATTQGVTGQVYGAEFV
jgi:hypothetical protein